ncbi:DEAD/DEAH box helicase family protein [uncultured Corynebacterium sp.]|uniref:restriction endonuclease n=1 Tax=uncultured Corynebacterium sp. TaxID=159447 RepID=UPI0025D4C4B8|nr:DEAD/DEAH box helicase family protein [uncultured Corynebacterium sp.]
MANTTTTGSGFQFDASQQYQLDAISAVADLLEGQPKHSERLLTSLRGSAAPARNGDGALDYDLTQDVGAIGNNLVVDRDLILSNLQRVQDRNGLEVDSSLFDEESLDFDIEMETGTGKTYVYLRTIFELAARYNFTKFVILVPSVAIKEGVNTSIRLMRPHFENLYKRYGVNFDNSIYSGKNAEEVQPFATSTDVQIMVMTIDSIRGKKNLIMYKPMDRLNGLRPIDYLSSTHPVVIMDEPQNMESKLSKSAVGDLNPVMTLRYSATHKKKRNVVYRLDPVDAHELGLVKQIVVADVHQEGSDAAPYIRLVDVRREPTWSARLELSVRKADGSQERRVVTVKRNEQFSAERLTNNPVYEGWRVTDMALEPPRISLSLHDDLYIGDTVGESTEVIYKEMIRETVREHLRKEALLRPQHIKVLSLFFIDKVEHFLGNGANNTDADGDFVQWFDDVFREESARPGWAELFPEGQDPAELRRGYFSVLKGKKGVADRFKDSSGTTAADDDAYELIMTDKERLLDEDEPVRFIFSHSALREGWDNPNVFQICSLRDMAADTERRQTLGRGLRLPVTQTRDGFVRVPDRSIATLTVVANESYTQFADGLQKEYKDAGVEIGKVRKSEFSKLPVPDENGALTEELLGYRKSREIWEHLKSRKFLYADGSVNRDRFQPNTLDFTLDLPDQFAWAEDEIIELMNNANIGKYVKARRKRRARKCNKELYLTEEFEDFWETISQRTTYKVKVNRDQLISQTVAELKELGQTAPITPLRITVTTAGVRVLRGGTRGEEIHAPRAAELRGSYDLPDIITELQEATSLTRRTIIDILLESGRLQEFIGNPNDFIAQVKRVIQKQLSFIVVEGIQYEKIRGSVYELRELKEDGAKEKEHFLDTMYKVRDTEKTDFDYVVYDSDVERQFAEKLDSRKDIKMFMKLPPKFRIDTPVGAYNPDWAIIKQENGEDRIYMIRETKSTDDPALRRPSENAKIEAARKHFKAIGVGDYAVSTPGAWKLDSSDGVDIAPAPLSVSTHWG